MAVNLEVRGYHALVSNPTTSHLNISLNQTKSQVLILTPEGLVIPYSSYPIAPPLQASFFFPTEILSDPSRCQSHIGDQLPAVLGFRLPSMANAVLAAHLVLRLEELNREAVQNNGARRDHNNNDNNNNNNMFDGYYFSAEMEIINPDLMVDAVVDVGEILEDINAHFPVQEDGLLDEEATSRTRTSRTAIEKLKAGRFVADDDDDDQKKQELGSCCICLEEMSCGGKELVGLPNCQHVFHEHCILQWLEKTNSCPLCRTPLVD